MPNFKPIPGFPGYEASDDGHIWSSRRGQRKQLKGGWIRGKKGKKKYRFVSIRNHLGAAVSKTVHRLIWITFNGPIPDNIEINHLGDKEDNSLGSLELATRKQNVDHAQKTGLCPFGDGHGRALLRDKDVLEIRKLSKNGVTAKELAARYGVAPTTISAITTRKSWKHL